MGDSPEKKPIRCESNFSSLGPMSRLLRASLRHYIYIYTENGRALCRNCTDGRIPCLPSRPYNNVVYWVAWELKSVFAVRRHTGLRRASVRMIQRQATRRKTIDTAHTHQPPGTSDISQLLTNHASASRFAMGFHGVFFAGRSLERRTPTRTISPCAKCSVSVLFRSRHHNFTTTNPCL